jgi:L-iditol 2-dehydrogenase
MGMKEPPTAKDLGPDQVFIDIEAVGICGSDLHYYKDGGIGAAKIEERFVPGHEFAARMVADDELLGVHAGELVAVDPAKPCGKCEWCKRHHHNLCPYVEFTGAPPLDGAMTTRIPIGREQIFKIPQEFSVLEALMLEPLGVAIHAMDLAKPGKRLLETVCIVGCGPIGLKIIQLCRLAGVERIFAIDPLVYRAEVICPID